MIFSAFVEDKGSAFIAEGESRAACFFDICIVLIHDPAVLIGGLPGDSFERPH